MRWERSKVSTDVPSFRHASVRSYPYFKTGGRLDYRLCLELTQKTEASGARIRVWNENLRSRGESIGVAVGSNPVSVMFCYIKLLRITSQVF